MRLYGAVPVTKTQAAPRRAAPDAGPSSDLLGDPNADCESESLLWHLLQTHS